MGLFSRITSPLRGYRLLRRLLAELRAIHRALDRQADALELAAGLVPREQARAQVFRSYAHTREPLGDKAVQDLTEVSYVDNRAMAAMLAKEEELRMILGKDPTPEQVVDALEGREP